MRADLPKGTVTFLFTDVEGSTRLLAELGADAYAAALAEHRRVIREACASEDGVEVDTQGDAFFFAFPTAPGALTAASSFTQALASGPIQVRVGLHTGTPLLTDEGYVGPDVHRAARIADAGHGGQVLVSASTAVLVGADGLRDLGEHRLRDLSAPERIHQLGDGDFPQLKTLYRTNLPVPATAFLGREAELARVVEFLTAHGQRLLTLTGPGGTGKTRLALQAAAAASEIFPDGVFWVPLAPLRDPELVLPSLARTLAVSEEPGTPLEHTLVAHLTGKSLLLLLDNVEHLLPLAAVQIAALRTTNGSCLLVTSRERLRIAGEQAWPVPPLGEDDATALFLARARAVDPGFTPSPAVDELCARLDELPLAIELAAARTAVFSAEQLLRRVSQRLDLLKGDRDADPRQQTLRATIEWSHDLLTSHEQRIFARLAVFAGGCTYEAAADVAGADPDTLQSLLDKSIMLKRYSGDEPRYWMLETIREYALERLEALSEADQLRRVHAEWFLVLAEKAEPHLRQNSSEWVDRLEQEHENIRAALDQLDAADEHELALRFTGALSRFWYLHSHLAEGRRRLDAALRFAGRGETRAKALTGASMMAQKLGDTEASRLYAEKALALRRALGDAWGIAYGEMQIGIALGEEGDFASARLRLADSYRTFVELGDEHYASIAANNLGWVSGELGDKDRERTLYKENLARTRALGNRRQEGISLQGLASLERDAGRVGPAVEMLKVAIAIFRDLGDRLELAMAVGRMANLLALSGDLGRAAQLLASSEALTEALGVKTPWWAAERNEKTLGVIRSGLEDASVEVALAHGRSMSLDDAVALALDDAK